MAVIEEQTELVVLKKEMKVNESDGTTLAIAAVEEQKSIRTFSGAMTICMIIGLTIGLGFLFSSLHDGKEIDMKMGAASGIFIWISGSLVLIDLEWGAWRSFIGGIVMACSTSLPFVGCALLSIIH